MVGIGEQPTAPADKDGRATKLARQACGFADRLHHKQPLLRNACVYVIADSSICLDGLLTKIFVQHGVESGATFSYQCSNWELAVLDRVSGRLVWIPKSITTLV